MSYLKGIFGFQKGDMKLILTGALGFVASNVAARLKERGYESYNIDDLSFGSEKNAVGEWHKEGFQNLTEEQLSEYDVLLHLATSNIIFAMSHPLETFKTNALDTMELFDKFKGKIIYTSTASIYGDATVIPTPEDASRNLTNAYDTSKYIAEMFLKQRGNYTTLRLSNVYGINQRASNPFCGVMGKLLQQAMNGAKMTIIGDGMQTRDFTYVEDVVDAIELAVNQEAKDTEINIATGIETRIKELPFLIGKAIEYNTIETTNDVPIRAIDSLTRRCLDISKAKRLLGWEPKHTLEQGLKKTVAWMKKENTEP